MKWRIQRRGKYYNRESSIPFFTSLKWKFYLLCLRVRLWLNDLYVEWYIRTVLKQGYEMEMDPEVVFNKLIQ